MKSAILLLCICFRKKKRAHKNTLYLYNLYFFYFNYFFSDNESIYNDKFDFKNQLLEKNVFDRYLIVN